MTTKLVNDYFNAKSAIQRVEEELRPYKERFHTFLAEQEPNGYVDYVIDESLCLVEGYALDMSDDYSTTAITYLQHIDGGDFYFIIPSEYISDPEAWESEMLSNRERIKNDVLEAISKIGLYVGEDFSLSVEPHYGDGLVLVLLNAEMYQSPHWPYQSKSYIFDEKTKTLYNFCAGTALRKGTSAEELEKYKVVNPMNRQTR